jgi:hypothetical protein
MRWLFRTDLEQDAQLSSDLILICEENNIIEMPKTKD